MGVVYFTIQLSVVVNVICSNKHLNRSTFKRSLLDSIFLFKNAFYCSVVDNCIYLYVPINTLAIVHLKDHCRILFFV